MVQHLFFTLCWWLPLAALPAAEFSEGGPIPTRPALDTGMVTMLGTSHGGYLVHKPAPQTPRTHGNGCGA